eukprot:scaffold8184_cov164-Skeletonema_marinoi.AAC.4
MLTMCCGMVMARMWWFVVRCCGGVCDEVEGSKTKASEQSLAQAAPLKTDDFFDKQHERCVPTK